MLNKRCLVLNASWFPIAIRPLYVCLKKVCLERATIISPVDDGGSASYQEFTWDQWVEKEHTPGKQLLRSKRLKVEVPEIVKVKYAKMHIQKLPLKAENIFARDGHCCWYCGSDNRLTIDHIVPQSKGGLTVWKNVITCCFSCNNVKGDTDVKKFCEIKNVPIPKPANVGSLSWIKQLGKTYPDSWKKWLSFNQ